MQIKKIFKNSGAKIKQYKNISKNNNNIYIYYILYENYILNIVFNTYIYLINIYFNMYYMCIYIKYIYIH